MNLWLLLLIPFLLAVYGFVEARSYRKVNYRLAVLPVGSEPVRILQLSDLHFRRERGRMRRFLREQGKDSFDLILATGDLLGDPRATQLCAELLNQLNGRYGRFFVFGSSDYYAPVLKNYFDYFRRKRRLGTKPNRTREFKSLLEDGGWVDLRNNSVELKVGDLNIQFAGLDDPYMNRDDRSVLVRQPGAQLAICVTHDPAPYKDAEAAGFDLTVGGHTHGGQVRLPFIGALVTNSDVPRRLCKGHSIIGNSHLFVTPGLGTGKYAPFRLLCPPEVSVLELVEKS